MHKKILIPVLALVVIVSAIAFVYTSSQKSGVSDKVTTTTTTPSNSNPNDQNMDTTGNTSAQAPKAPLTDLEINDTVVGSGAVAEKGDLLTVHYTGKLSNGVVFDSSYVRKQPFEFQLGAGMVIEGWDKGLVGMKIGGKRSLSIPASMAYGMVERGSIPAGSDLYFEVELVSIKGK
ncbi:MAG: FKBP-type peptidyl-prolyl cis-trans isomerase [Patescibacteria group bacterium]